MTPKEALRKIKEVCPSITKIVKVTHVVDPTVFGIREQESNIEWGDTTEYTEPQYRPVVITDVPSRPNIEYSQFANGDWVEAVLIGVTYCDEGPAWIIMFNGMNFVSSQCRIAVK